jgi:hypothetical protein
MVAKLMPVVHELLHILRREALAGACVHQAHGDIERATGILVPQDIASHVVGGSRKIVKSERYDPSFKVNRHRPSIYRAAGGAIGRF